MLIDASQKIDSLLNVIYKIDTKLQAGLFLAKVKLHLLN